MHSKIEFIFMLFTMIVGILDVDVLLEYFTMHNPVLQGLDGRISFQTEDDISKLCNRASEQEIITGIYTLHSL